MVDVRSEKQEVKSERRAHPRLELHCDTKIPGLKGIQTLTDISFGGCFIEAKIPGKVKLGQAITLNTKLPTEKNEIEVKAKIVNQRERGIGCEFISLKDDARDAICLCFEMYKDTLPAGEQEAQWENECLETVPEVPPAESNKDITTSPLSEISDTSQIKSVKSQRQHGMLLKVGVGLTAVLLAGFFVAKTIIRTSPDPEPEMVTRHAAVAIPQSHTIKAQIHSIDSIDDKGGKKAQHDQSPKIEDENTHSQNIGLTEEQIESQTGEEPIETVETPHASKVETSEISFKEAPDQNSSGTHDQKLVGLNTQTTANISSKALYSIEVGPIFSKRDLKDATGILHDRGLDPEKIIEMGKINVVRLFEGSYTRDLAQERLKEIQEIVDSAFVIPEKGKYSIYVATYHDRDKAVEKSKQLAKSNIKVTAVPAEIKLRGTKLVVKQVERPNMSIVLDQMSKIGLPVNILESD